MDMCERCHRQEVDCIMYGERVIPTNTSGVIRQMEWARPEQRLCQSCVTAFVAPMVLQHLSDMRDHLECAHGLPEDEADALVAFLTSAVEAGNGDLVVNSVCQWAEYGPMALAAMHQLLPADGLIHAIASGTVATTEQTNGKPDGKHPLEVLADDDAAMVQEESAPLHDVFNIIMDGKADGQMSERERRAARRHQSERWTDDDVIAHAHMEDNDNDNDNDETKGEDN